MAAATDLFRKKESNFSTTLSASITDADTTIPLSSATGLPTDTAITLTIDRVDANAVSTPTKVERVTGVVSGNNLTACLRGEDGTTAQAHDSAAVVEDIWDGETWNDALTGLLVEHNQDGTHSTLTSPTLTTPVINGAVTGTITPPNTFYSTLMLSEGQMLHGRIVPSVASNNLTVALKHVDSAGNLSDPSATKPVYVRIGGVNRSITAALSVTLVAGTNWMNMGGAELATKEGDLFVYLGWNVSGGNPLFGPGRIPYAQRIADSTTVVNGTEEKGVQLTGTAGGAATDPICVIGRFAATLSAGAGYTWAVPTFTDTNLIQRPIYETRELLWVSTASGSGSLTYTIASYDYLNYKVVGSKVFIRLRANGTTGGTTNKTIYLTLPFDALGSYGVGELHCGGIIDNSVNVAGVTRDTSVNNRLGIQRYDYANWTLAAGTYVMIGGCFSLI